MKNFTKHLKTIGASVSLIALLFAWSNNAEAQCSSTTAGTAQTSGNTGTSQTWSQNANSYVQLSSVTNGAKYYISSATSTDYFTIKSVSGGSTGTVITKGTTPLTFTASATTIYIVLNTNSSCSTSSNARTITLAAVPTITSVPSSACIGSTITVTGTALSGITSASVNGTSVGSFSITNSTSMTITIPTGTTTGTISVTGPGGTATSSSITINPLPIDNSGANQSICNGSSVSIGATSTSGHTYSWSPSTRLTSSTTANPTANPTTSTTYTLTETITATGCSTANSTSVTVTSAPATPGTITGNTTVCQNGSFVYSISAVSGATSYNWTVPSGWNISAGSGTTSLTVTAGSSGGTVSVTAQASSCISSASTLSITNTGTTVGTPVVTGPTTMCSGSTQIYSATSTNAATFNWTVPSGFTLVSGQGSSSITVTAGSAAVGPNISVYGTNACSSNGSTASTSLTIYALPGNDAGSAKTICNGTSTTLGASSTTGHTYSWTPSTGLSSSTVSNPTANPTVTTTYTLTETITSTGCSTWNTVSVTVNSIAGDDAGADKSICVGSNTTIGATSTSGHTYSWSPSTGLSSSTVANPTATPTTSTTYTLTETITATGCSAANSVIVTVNALPIDNSGANQSVCNGSGIAIGATSTTGHTYSWSPSASLSSSTAANPTATPTATTTYSLTETITATGCSATNTTVVTDNASPANETVTAASSSACSGTSINIQLASSQSGVSYQLRNNSGNTSIGSSVSGTGSAINLPTGILTTTTTFNVLATNNSTSCTTQMSATPSVTINSAPSVSVSPSPATICSGSISTLTASNSGGTTGSTVTGSNTTVVAGNGTDPQSISTSITMGSGTLTSLSNITLTMNVDHTWSGDVKAVLTSPCGTSTIFSSPGGTTDGDDLTGTYVFTTTAGVTFPGSNGSQVPTGTYTATFSGLSIYPTCSSVAGTWTLTLSTISGGHDRVLTLHNWSISIQSGSPYTTAFTGPATIGSVTYSGSYNASASASVTPSSGSNVYTATTTDANGCTASGTTTVTLYTAPTNITPTGTATICSGNSANISIANSQSGVNYQLRNNSGNALIGSSVAGTGGTITLPTGALTSTTTLNVLATSTSTSCSTQMTSTVTITVNAAPGNDAGSDKTLCAGSSVSLGGTSTTGHTYSWSPSSGLSSATTANPTATPTATTTYTLTETITATGCSATNAVAVTYSSIPSVSITPNYCAGGGNVQLTATSGSSYSWSTGGTNQSITVNIAGTDTVIVTNAAGCSASASYTVALELVTNGNFSQGNVGFTSAYSYVTGAGSLYPEGLYSVGSNANYYHSNFFGTDHTTGTGNFMIVNGAGTPVIVWTETVTLIPNTYYYFSAWAMSMNNVNPWAELQFSVNGVQVGTIDSLATGVETTSGPFVWTKFYATWNSGTNTTVTLSIVDLETAAGGNDFGLDDISCSTLSTIPLSAAPTTNSPVCVGNTLTLNSNVTGGMYPLTYSWTGPNSWTSKAVKDSITNSTTAVAGVYNITVTDTHGCTTSASTPTVTINSLPTDKTPTAASSSICTGSSTNIQIALSQSGVNYQLRNNTGNTTIGSAVAGTGGTINLPTGTLTANTTFNVLATNATSSCSVEMVNTVAVTVNAQSANPTSASASPSSICSGQNSTLTLNGGGGGTNETIKWYTSSCGGTLAGTGNNVVVNPAATTIYYGRYEDGTPCSYNSACVSVTLTVIAAPANNAGTAKTICPGASTSLGATSTAGHTYSWSPATALSSSTISNPTASPTITTTYTLTETITVTGCSASNTVVVTANPIPGNDAGSAATICDGTGTALGAASTAGHTYSWSPSTALSSSTVSNPTASPTVTTTYTLTETITATGCSAANSVVITAIPYDYAGSNQTSCSGATVSLGSASHTGYTYTWTPSAGLSSSTIANPTATPTTTTTYTLTETTSGCTASFTQVITVNAAPGNNTTGNQSICIGSGIAIGATSTAGHTYSWSPSTALTSSTVANPTANPTATTTYTLTETITATGCSTVNSAVVTVNSLPGNNAGSNQSTCNGTGITIGTTSTTGHTYSWSPAATLSSSTVSNPTATPTVATTYTLTETITASGCTASNTVAVAINAAPVNNAGSAKTICSGSSTSLGTTSTAGHTYSWSPSTGLSSSTVSNPTANPTTTTTYTLTETITATSCSVANAVVVTVNSLPANDAGSAQAICTGGSTSIGATSATGHTYSWSPSTALSSSTVANPTANPATTSTYTLTETITATGCSAANSVVVTVNSLPSNNAGSTQTICSGANATIGAASTSGHTYSWSPSATLSSSTASNPSATPTVATTYTLTETISATGCSVSNTVAIAVNIESANPTSATASASTICSGSSTTLILNGGGGGTGEVIKWYTVSCGGTLAGTGNNLSVSPTTSTTYYGRYEDAAPCSYNSTCASITITVNASSGSPTSASASPTAICNGQSTTLTLNGGGGGASETVKWYTSACGGTLAGTGNGLSISPTATTTYYGRYEDGGVCNYNTSCMPVTVTVNTAPTNNAGSSQTICSLGSLTIGNSSTAGHTYVWLPSPGLSSSTVSNPTANPTTTTTYTLTETITASGCSASNSVTITVNPGPGNNAGSNQTICTGGSVAIGATNTTGHTYSWSPSTSLSSSTVSNPTANPTTTTTYTLTETITATGCSAANAVTVTVNAGPGNNAGTSKSVCNGSGIAIGATTTAGHTYSWSPSTGLSSSTVSNPTATPSSTSTYTLTETITASGCSVSNAVTVTVNALPGNDAGSAQTVCSGSAVAVGAASTAGHTYSWSPSTALSSSTVANPSANPTVSTTYTLTETITATGCSAANTVAVGVSTSPGNNAGSAKSICNGSSTTLGATSTAVHTYSWSPSTGLSSSSISNPTANPTATTTYSLAETITASGCSVSNTVIVTVNAIPSNDAGTSGNTICSGSNTTIGANSTAGHTYSWSPTTGLSSSTNAKPTATPTTTTTYTLTETITSTGCSASNAVVVNVTTTSSVTVQPFNQTACSGAGGSVSFTATASGSPTYQWYQKATGLLQSFQSLSDGTAGSGAVYSGSATSTLTISSPPASITGYLYYCVITNACNSVTTNTVTLTVAGSAGTWIGGLSTDWNTAGNWCGSVPTSTTNVTIPSGTTYPCIISGTGTAYCDNLTINSGASLTINAGGYLKMYGNPSISGTYSHPAGILELDGTAMQTLPAMAVDSIEVNNSNGVTLSGNLTVNSYIKLTSGIVTTGSNEVNVTNAATNSVMSYSSASYVVGNLVRSVNGSGSYDYPLGTSSKYEFLNITLASTTGFTNISGIFTNANPLQGLLGVLLNLGTILVGGTEISSLLDYGYWTLTPNSTLTAGSYTVEAHEQGQSNAGPTPNSYALLKRHSSSDSWAALGTHNNNTQSVTNGVVKAVCSNLTSFSDYSIGYGGGVLPIKLESFTAQLYNENKDAFLEWVTASEEDCDHFDIEVAADVNSNGDLSFYKLGMLPGHGTSFVQNNYSFIDTQANKSGIRYYRLKQVNQDSTFTYTDIVPLTFPLNTIRLSALYPNPVQTTLHFELSSPDDEGIDVYVNGMSGQMLFKERLQLGIGNNNFSFDVSELAKALYLFNVANDNNSVSIHDKFEKY